MNKPIKTNQNLYKEIFDSLPDGIIVIDRSFLVLSMNDAAEAIFKISRKKAFGKPTSSFLPEEIDETAEKALKEERTVFGDEINPVLRGGEKISIQVTASPLFSDKGELLGVIIQVKDLVGTKFLSEKTLQQISTSTMEELLVGLAHELKNPLGGIRGAAQIIVDGKSNKEERIKCGEIIIKEADRLKALLETLQGLEPFAKEVFEPVDIHEMLLEIIFLESKSKDLKQIQFLQNFDVTLPLVLGDKNTLKQVFLNLIKNAVEAVSGKQLPKTTPPQLPEGLSASPPYGIIEISTRWITDYKLKHENAISIDIKDNGVGIPKDALEKIFSPFYTTKKNGSGLGLFFAYQIIAKHGGAIQVESELGKGTLFKVYLPVSKR
jgi:two-component system nitrogen regulation sensor histidine kinase GlnL